MSIYKGNKKIAGLYKGEDLEHSTETHAGIIEIATQEEVNAGNDDTKVVTPSKNKEYVGTAINAYALQADTIYAKRSQFVICTKEQYDAIPEKVNGTLYFILRSAAW